MTDKPGEPKSGERDYSQTLFLPQTEFPMRAGLPQREPELLRRWEKLDLYKRLRETAKGRDKFVLPADRMEDRGGELPLQEQAEAKPVRSRRDYRFPQGLPRLCRTLARRAARGV